MPKDLPSLWREQQHAPFPFSCRKLNVGGMTLLQLDVTLGKILTDCMRRDGVPRSLRDEQKVELKRCRNLLERALAELTLDDPSRTYFSRLNEILGRIDDGNRDSQPGTGPHSY